MLVSYQQEYFLQVSEKCDLGTRLTAHQGDKMEEKHQMVGIVYVTIINLAMLLSELMMHVHLYI